MKRNAFIDAALEELKQEVALGEQPTTTVSTTEVTPVASADAAIPVTEVNIDQSVDAVAALMAKNASLQDQNASLEEESFDSDLDILDSASDSAQNDLAEAVSACEALQELAYIADLSTKSGQANATSVASLAFGLEQICLRVGLESPVAGLEDNAIALYHPKSGTDKEATSEKAATAQADAIGKSAMEKAKEIMKKLAEGIKRIVGWVLNILRQFFTRIGGLPDRIQKAAAEYDQIDESKTIDSGPFIASLRLVEGGGDVNKQFETYAHLTTKTLFGFLSDKFVNHMKEALKHLKDEETDEAKSAGREQLVEVLRSALTLIYTEDATSADMSGGIAAGVTENNITFGKTPPCIGGVQLYLAAALDDPNIWYCRSGLVKNPPKIDAPASIPVVNKQLADQMFGAITKWLRAQRDLEKNLTVLQAIEIGHWLSSDNNKTKAISNYLSTLASIATGAMPHLLRMNIQNSVNFVSYVEKSIAVSKAAIAEKK